MTANWFIQNFRKVTKYTPMQYILNLRITNAMNLIDNTNYNMSQIASAIGYENSMYFSRIFKKHTVLLQLRINKEIENRDNGKTHFYL